MIGPLSVKFAHFAWLTSFELKGTIRLYHVAAYLGAKIAIYNERRTKKLWFIAIKNGVALCVYAAALVGVLVSLSYWSRLPVPHGLIHFHRQKRAFRRCRQRRAAPTAAHETIIHT